MKSKGNTFGIIVFTALATTAFVYMVQRPAIEAQITQFGMPAKAAATEEPKAAPELVEEKTPEKSMEVEKVEASPEATTETKPEETSTEEKPKEATATE